MCIKHSRWGVGRLKRIWRLGAVSYLNSKPLVHGLGLDDGVAISFDVPAMMPALLADGKVDVALAPVIDYLRHHASWELLSDACIGCDGETLTVKIFSQVPPDEITALEADRDSHTSIALAAVIWNEMYGSRLQFRTFDPEQIETSQAVLVIGDKVVNRRPTGFAFEIDLGGAWKTLTGLPFVFAAWFNQHGADVEGLDAILRTARDRGVGAADLIATEQAPTLGWPVPLAKQYLSEYLDFTMTPQHLEGMELFFELSQKWGIVPPTKESILA